MDCFARVAFMSFSTVLRPCISAKEEAVRCSFNLACHCLLGVGAFQGYKSYYALYAVIYRWMDGTLCFCSGTIAQARRHLDITMFVDFLHQWIELRAKVVLP
eukprot:2218743-Amphidinium_carterae.1